MKRNEIKALASKTAVELSQEMTRLEAAIAKARLEKAAGKLTNIRQVATLQDDLARVKTIQRQMELGLKV